MFYNKNDFLKYNIYSYAYKCRRHRQVLVDALNDPCEEMEFLKEVFACDAKNYHTWAYRLI